MLLLDLAFVIVCRRNRRHNGEKVSPRDCWTIVRLNAEGP